MKYYKIATNYSVRFYRGIRTIFAYEYLGKKNPGKN